MVAADPVGCCDVSYNNKNMREQEHCFDFIFPTEEETLVKEMSASSDRLQVVKDLQRVALGEDRSERNSANDIMLREHLEYKESNPSPYGVTLGIEIEIPLAAVLPAGEKEKMNRGQKKKYLHDLREKYEATQAMGLPAGADQFWEFADAPANNPTTLAREVQSLIGMKLIDPSFGKFPLHVTIWGMTFKGEKDFNLENNTHLLARVLDATGWEIDGERLLAPYTDPKNSD